MPQKPILTESIVAAGAIAANRFVGFNNAQLAAAGAVALGVADYAAAAANSQIAVTVLGTAEVVAGGAIARGDEVMSDAQGRAVVRAGAGAHGVARALEPAAAAGQMIEVLLIPARAPAPAA